MNPTTVFFLGNLFLIVLSLTLVLSYNRESRIVGWERSVEAKGEANLSRKKRSGLIQNDDPFKHICWKYGSGYPTQDSREDPSAYEECAVLDEFSRDESNCSRYTVCAPSNDDDYLHRYPCECEGSTVFNLKTNSCTKDHSDCPTSANYLRNEEASSSSLQRPTGIFSPDLSSHCLFTGRFPMEHHCDKFLQCLPGPPGVYLAFVHECPPEKHFSKHYRGCLNPYLARCPYNLDETAKPHTATPSRTEPHILRATPPTPAPTEHREVTTTTPYDNKRTRTEPVFPPRNSTTYDDELPVYYEPGDDILRQLRKYYKNSTIDEYHGEPGSKNMSARGKPGQKYLFTQLSFNHNDAESTFDPNEDPYESDNVTTASYQNKRPRTDPVFPPRNSTTYDDELPVYYEPGDDILRQLRKYYKNSTIDEYHGEPGSKNMSARGKPGQKYLFTQLSFNHNDAESKLDPNEDPYESENVRDDHPHNNQGPPQHSEHFPEYSPDGQASSEDSPGAPYFRTASVNTRARRSLNKGEDPSGLQSPDQLNRSFRNKQLQKISARVPASSPHSESAPNAQSESYAELLDFLYHLPDKPTETPPSKKTAHSRH